MSLDFVAGVGLLALAGLISARTWWQQGALAVALVIYAGWVCWRRLDRPTETAQEGLLAAPAPGRKPLAGLEVLIWLLAAPWLWFPTLRPEVTALAVLLLALGWLAAWAAGGGLWPRSRYDLALTVLLGMATLGAWCSPFPALTLSKVAGCCWAWPYTAWFCARPTGAGRSCGHWRAWRCWRWAFA